MSKHKPLHVQDKECERGASLSGSVCLLNDSVFVQLRMLNLNLRGAKITGLKD